MKSDSDNLIRMVLSLIAFVLGLISPQWAGAASFTNGSPLNTGRYLHVAALLHDGRVLVTGGISISPLSNRTELYNPASGRWTEVGSLRPHRYGHTATVLTDGKVLVVGGRLEYDLAPTELFDPSNDTWAVTSLPNFPRIGYSATLLRNGNVLIAGGTRIADGFPVTTAELFSPATGTWTNTGAMTTTGSYRTMLLPNGKVLAIAAGENVELYDPDTGIWTHRPPIGLRGGITTLLSNGDVLIVTPTGSQLYDPVSHTLKTMGQPQTPRDGHTATLLPNGKVLIAGGNASGLQSSAELYDPLSRTWGPTNPMSTNRISATATPLFNGQVLIAGGAWSASMPLDTTDLYDSANVLVTPISLTVPGILPDHTLQFCFTNTPDISFVVLGATNPANPLSMWTSVDGLSEIAPGKYQFTDVQATNRVKIFYRVRSP